MIHERIELGDCLFETYVMSGFDNTFSEKKSPFVIVCPGGGYSFLAAREGECMAHLFNVAGCNAGVLYYSVKPARFPKALCELSQAIAKVRENADIWNTDPDKIAVIGFSAGGHLAASIATMWHEDWLDQASGTSKEQRRPNALLLGYPVLTLEHCHKGSFDNLLGVDASVQEREFQSLEKHITEFMVPTFIWSTWTDSTVPIENTLVFVNELKKHDVSCELHIYSQGEHGLGLATKPYTCEKHPVENNRVATWAGHAISWLDSVFKR
jgi:acetyl esterase/lipase